MAVAFYLTTLAGAAAIYLLLSHRRSLAVWGALIGVGLIGTTAAHMLVHFSDQAAPGLYYWLFAVIALTSAVKVITHTRPVYCALYFVLVVLATSGMLVLLEAEFMAMAMVIIYAGAILVTYMFVIMLATQPPSTDEPDASPLYDRVARQPLLAVIMGFALLTVISGALLKSDPPDRPYPTSPIAAASSLAGKFENNKAFKQHIETTLRKRNLISTDEHVISVDPSQRRVDVQNDDYSESPRKVELDDALLATMTPNIDHIGLGLFERHTLGIELAAVILLLAVVGAIVISQRKVSEKRTASGIAKQ